MYQHPGVYIEHVPSNSLAIEAASTSVTAIIGHTRRGASVKKDGAKPQFISSLSQYVKRFGPADGAAAGVKNLGNDPDAMGMAVNAYFANGGSKAYIVPVANDAGKKAEATLVIDPDAAAGKKNLKLTFKDVGTWANGLLAELKKGAIDGTFDLTIGTFTTEGANKKIDLALETFTGLVFEKTDLKFAKSVINGTSSLVDAAMDDDAKPKNDDTITDVTSKGEDPKAPVDADYKAALEVLEDHRDISIILLPDVMADTKGKVIYQSAITHAEKMKNRMVIVDPEDKDVPDPKSAKETVFSNSPYAALYYPWLRYGNPYYDAETNPGVPATFDRGPSAVAAGMWARIDGTRGVWKAPAGLEATVRGSLGPTRMVGNAAQDNLNEWGVNALRAIVGPTVIWGARTTATKAKPQYRYVSVRRTQNMIGESLYNALQAAVFEPNGHKLWSGLRASIGNFMDGLHRAGAFQGEKASDAYFVRCGLGSTMTQGDIDAGIVRVVVGFAPLKPAEFVVVEIQQIVGQTA